MVELKFLKSFSSPVLGNVWPGRVAAVKPKTAQRLIDIGYAEPKVTKETKGKTGPDKGATKPEAKKGKTK